MTGVVTCVGCDFAACCDVAVSSCDLAICCELCVTYLHVVVTCLWL